MAGEKEKIVRSRTVSFQRYSYRKSYNEYRNRIRGRNTVKAGTQRSRERSAMNLKLKKFTVMIQLKT